MIIGYISPHLNAEQQLIIETISDKTFTTPVLSVHLNTITKMKTGDQLLLFDYLTLGLTISQYGNLRQFVMDNGLTIKFIKLMNKEHQLLDQIAIQEKNLMQHRTQRGLINARKNGRIGGRPQIDDQLKVQINQLYTTQKMTIREIAAALDVSIGTVHKYSRQHA